MWYAARGSGAELDLPEAGLAKRGVERHGAHRREGPAAAMNIVNEVEEEAESSGIRGSASNEEGWELGHVMACGDKPGA